MKFNLSSLCLLFSVTDYYSFGLSHNLWIFSRLVAWCIFEHGRFAMWIFGIFETRGSHHRLSNSREFWAVTISLSAHKPSTMHNLVLRLRLILYHRATKATFSRSSIPLMSICLMDLNRVVQSSVEFLQIEHASKTHIVLLILFLCWSRYVHVFKFSLLAVVLVQDVITSCLVVAVLLRPI